MTNVLTPPPSPVQLRAMLEECYAEEVKQWLHEKKKGGSKKTAPRVIAARPMRAEAPLFNEQEDEE